MKKLHLESLRGIAALSVVFYHYSLGFLHLTLLKNGFIDNAWLMVDFFFVLSGYVIALSYGDRISNWSELLNFQWKRFLRLYPLHLIMLLLFLALEVSKYIAGYSGEQNSVFGPTTGLNDFISNLFLTHNFTGDLSWNRPSWSISAEFYTYLLFAIWLIIYIRAPRFGMTLAIIIIGLSAFYIYQTSMRNASDGYFRCFMSFFMGALLVNVEKNFKIISSEILASAALIGTVLYLAMASSYPNWVLMLAPILYSAVILLLNALPKSSKLIKILSIPALVYLGAVSYGVYMIHDFVENISLSVINYGFKMPLAENPSANTRVLDLHPLSVTLIEIFIIGIVVYSAHLSYKYVELPILRRGRSLVEKEGRIPSTGIRVSTPREI